MEPTTATVLTAVYCLIDDCYRTEIAPHRPKRGRSPVFSDSEVLTLALFAQRHGVSERDFLVRVRDHWAPYFPHLLSQSAFNRRARSLVGVLAALVGLLARQLEALFGSPTYEVLDGVPMPVLRRCRGGRHRLFGSECAFGVGGSDHTWYYGLKDLIGCAPAGYITGFVAGPANTEERWLAEAFFRWRADPTALAPLAEQLIAVLGPSHRRGGQRLGPTGPINPPIGVGQPARVCYLGDNGYTGAAWQEHWREDYGVHLLTPAGLKEAMGDEPVERQASRWREASGVPLLTPAGLKASVGGETVGRKASRWLSRLRHVVERINSSLTDALHLVYCGGRSYFGILTRLAAKVAAHNVTLLVNHLLGRQLHAWLPAL